MPSDTSVWPGGQIYPGLDVTFVEPISYTVCQDGSFGSANVAWLQRFAVPAPLTVNTISVYIGSNNSGNLDVGLYKVSGSNLNRITSSGSTACGATDAVQDFTLADAITLAPGTIYYAAMANDTSATHVAYQYTMPAVMAGFLSRALKATTSFPLPATITSTANATLIPWLVVRNV